MIATSLATELARPVGRMLPWVGGGERPAIRSIAAMGDSISTGIDWNATPSRPESSYLWPLFALTDRRIMPVLSSTGRNFQTGGFSALQIRDVWLPQVITAKPDACVVLAGANSIPTEVGNFRPNLAGAANAIFQTVGEIVAGLKAAGIVPILATLTPDTFPTVTTWPPGSGNYHPDYRITRAMVNDLIRTHAGEMGAILCDWSGELSSDPGNDEALADSGYLIDNIHPYDAGEWKLGFFLHDVVRRNFRLAGEAFEIPADGSGQWATGNPYFSGDLSGLGTGWGVFTTGSPAPIAVASKTGDGWQRLFCENGPSVGVNSSYYLSRFAQVTNNQFDGKWYRGIAEVYPESAAWEIWQISLRCTAATLDSTPSTLNADSPGFPNSTTVALMGKYWTWQPKFLFVTPPFQHPGGAGADRRRLTVNVYVRGRGAIRVRVAGIFEVE